MKKQIEVLRFDEFVNEEFKFSGLRNWTIIFLALFYNFKGDVPRKFNEPKFVENYVKNLPKLNNNQRVRDIISEVKNRVLKDTKISNKQEILKKIDETLIVIRREDEFMKIITDIGNKEASGRLITFKINDNTQTHSIIILEKDFNDETLTHELNHVVENNIKQDMSGVEKMFNFNMNFKEYNNNLKMMTNGDYYLPSSATIDKEYRDYLKTELYVRLNGFKRFLYNHKLINNSNDSIKEYMINNILSGRFYKNLSDEDKEIFSHSDFLEIFMFLDREKWKGF